MLGSFRWRRSPTVASPGPPLAAQRSVAGLCEVCRRWTAGVVCDDCVARHAVPRARCGCCARPLALALPRCPDCLREPPPYEHVRCAVDYGFPWDRLLAAFKYRGRAELAAPCARLIQRTLGSRSPDGDGSDDAEAAWPELLLPVPLTPARQAARGYNQAWEVARRLATALDRPASANVLVRRHDAPAQATLDRAARRRNLRGAFAAARPQVIAGRRVVLVDDVLTTGATAVEAALTLRTHGASAVRVWVVARTP
ncbi:MAG: ComF family protein [Rubrivivax sp.]